MKTRAIVFGMFASLTLLASGVAFGATPAKPAPKAQASELPTCAVCNDGKTAYCANPAEHRGLCSGHGGVKAFADGTAPKSRKARSEYR